MTRARLLGLLLAMLVGGLPAVALAQTFPYFNSDEPQCTTTNTAGVVFCENFEFPNPGPAPCNDNWGQYADSLVPSGDFDGCSKGWGMHFTDTGVPYPGNAECGAGVTPFGNCAGNHLQGAGSGGSGADHGLYPNRASYPDVYARWYQKFKTGYVFGAEKIFTMNIDGPNGAGIKWGNFSVNCADGSASATGRVTMGVPPPQDQCLEQNQGNNITIQSGNWYAFQVRIRVNTPVRQPDGLIEIWIDNCGPSGTSCTGTPTLRMRYTTIAFPRDSSSEMIRMLWWENWSNPSSSGETIVDQIKVATQGPIGFMGSTVVETPGTPSISVTVP